MTSAIDATKPITGSPTTASVRDNFLAAKNEIEDLQDADASLDARVSALEGGSGGSGLTSILQNLFQSTGAKSTSSTSIPGDDTIPQNTEGVQLFSQAITPTDAANIIEIEAVVSVSPSTTSACIAALFKDSGADAIAAMSASVSADNNAIITLRWQDSAGSTATRTYALRVGQSAGGTMTINGWGNARILGGALASTFRVREIALP